MSERLQRDTLRALGGPNDAVEGAANNSGATGAQDVIAAVAGKQIRLLSVTITVDTSSAVTINLLDGAGTLFTIKAGPGLVMPATIKFGRGLLLTAGNALRRSLSGAVNSVAVSATYVMENA